MFLVDMTESRKGRIIKANHMLQVKVGRGPIDARTLKRCQDVIDNNRYDFAPLARTYLDRLAAAIRDAREQKMDTEESIDRMTGAVMELKANAPLFRYEMVGVLANLMLGFLESIFEMDKNALEIVDAHHATLKIIITNRMEGDGGIEGKKLEAELKEAIRRYFDRF